MAENNDDGKVVMYHPDLPETQTIRVRERAVEAHERMGFKKVPKAKLAAAEKEKSA